MGEGSEVSGGVRWRSGPTVPLLWVGGQRGMRKGARVSPVAARMLGVLLTHPPCRSAEVSHRKACAPQAALAGMCVAALCEFGVALARQRLYFVTEGCHPSFDELR